MLAAELEALQQMIRSIYEDEAKNFVRLQNTSKDTELSAPVFSRSQ